MQRRSAFVVRAVDNKNRPNGRLRTLPRFFVTAKGHAVLEPKLPSCAKGKGYQPPTNTALHDSLVAAGTPPKIEFKDHDANFSRCWCNRAA